MRYLIGSQMDLAALPVIMLGFVAYVWVMERLLGKKAGVEKRAEVSTVRRVA